MVLMVSNRNVSIQQKIKLEATFPNSPFLLFCIRRKSKMWDIARGHKRQAPKAEATLDFLFFFYLSKVFNVLRTHIILIFFYIFLLSSFIVMSSLQFTFEDVFYGILFYLPNIFISELTKCLCIGIWFFDNNTEYVCVCLWFKEQLSSDVEYVTKIVNEYNEIVAKLSSAEVGLITYLHKMLS